MRMIDVDEVITSIQLVIEEENNPNSLGCLVMREIIKGLELTPSIDAVQVVRCKDCKELRQNNDKNELGWCPVCRFVRRYNDFCSYGERREE